MQRKMRVVVQEGFRGHEIIIFEERVFHIRLVELFVNSGTNGIHNIGILGGLKRTGVVHKLLRV